MIEIAIAALICLTVAIGWAYVMTRTTNLKQYKVLRGKNLDVFALRFGLTRRIDEGDRALRKRLIRHMREEGYIL